MVWAIACKWGIPSSKPASCLNSKFMSLRSTTYIMHFLVWGSEFCWDFKKINKEVLTSFVLCNVHRVDMILCCFLKITGYHCQKELSCTLGILNENWKCRLHLKNWKKKSGYTTFKNKLSLHTYISGQLACNRINESIFST